MKRDLGMACHTPPLNKMKQGEIPLPIQMGLRLGNGISSLFQEVECDKPSLHVIPFSFSDVFTFLFLEHMKCIALG